MGASLLALAKSILFLSVWYPELPSNDVATKLQLTSG